MRPVPARRHVLAWLVVLAAVAVGLVATPQTAAHAAGDAGAESQFVQHINSERSQRGLPALRTAGDLVSVARNHSQEMAANNKLYHNPNLASDVSNWQRVAENVGVGYGVSSLHGAFMDSSGHRANILDDQVTEIGVGVEVDGEGRIWVTQVFRLPANAPQPAPEPKPEPEPEPEPAPKPKPKPASQPDANAGGDSTTAQPTSAPTREPSAEEVAAAALQRYREAHAPTRFVRWAHGPWTSTLRSVR